MLPLTGPAAQIGTWQRNGIELALARVNPELRKGNKTIHVDYEDSGGDPKTGVSALQRLLALSKPIAVVSSLSSVSNAILPITNRDNLPTILLSVSHPTITADNPWAVRCHLGSEEEAQAMVNYLSTTGMRKFSLAYVNDDFGIGASESLEEFASSRKLKISTIEPYDKTATDLRTLATKLIRDKPRAIYVVGYVKSSVLLIKQLRELGYKNQILGNMALSVPSFIKLGGDALEGAIFTTSYLGAEVSPTSKAFVDVYKSKYVDTPTFFAAFAYDGVGLIASAMNSSNNRGSEALLANLRSIANYDGATGSLSVGADRKIHFPTRIVQIKRGQVVPLQ